MVKKYWLILTLVLGLSLTVGTQATAIGTTVDQLDGKQAVALVEDAFEVQRSLSEKPRQKADIETMLSEYFTDEQVKGFMEENLYKEGNGYSAFGSDFASYYIPFYEFDKETKAGFADGHWYIWEERSGDEEGPVSTIKGEEVVELTVEDGKWKVSGISYELPSGLKGN
ncbi:DUF3993 domain-containing protein [Rossellomorea marisflavi]|uniref:DUF3993 domain-containing protein n=1 Tax=Rossellomorea marisflavi TaxID=189381 RepID=UPI00064E5886|nr:DUF3993 domain-containing protein [Rossellomorea marisflavi]KML32657.1 hypothetical protein VL12_12650 [Rossellomorea marisflavi]